MPRKVWPSANYQAKARADAERFIDEAFLEMATDLDYRREALEILEEFAATDAEALAITEREMADE